MYLHPEICFWRKPCGRLNMQTNHLNQMNGIVMDIVLSNILLTARFNQPHALTPAQSTINSNANFKPKQI